MDAHGKPSARQRAVGSGALRARLPRRGSSLVLAHHAIEDAVLTVAADAGMPSSAGDR